MLFTGLGRSVWKIKLKIISVKGKLWAVDQSKMHRLRLTCRLQTTHIKSIYTPVFCYSPIRQKSYLQFY